MIPNQNTVSATQDAPPIDAAGAIDDAASTATPDTKLVPVTEAIRYRKRAQAAEQQLGELQSKLGEAEAELSKTRQTIASLERRQKIDALLCDADAVDVEVARLLTEAAVELMDEPDVALAIDDLRRSKPYLFHRRSAQAGAMPARSRGSAADFTDDAAQTAAASGNRRDLLRYLRLRRNGTHAVA